jgi:hypothetical protein
MRNIAESDGSRDDARKNLRAHYHAAPAAAA